MSDIKLLREIADALRVQARRADSAGLIAVKTAIDEAVRAAVREAASAEAAAWIRPIESKNPEEPHGS